MTEKNLFNDMVEEPQDGFEEEDALEEGEGQEGQEEQEEQEESYLTQEDFDRNIRRKHAQWERKFVRNLGFRNMEEAIPYLQAGRAVSDAAGVTPKEVLNRLDSSKAQSVATGYNQQTQVGGSNVIGVEQRLGKIEALLEDERTEQLIRSQEVEAKKEFGNLYDKYKEDIEDKADETGLSLVDAAAIVLRPQLREHIEGQTRAKQQSQRRRKVEGSNEPPTSGKVDYQSKLSPAQKETARKTGVSYERYYNQLKRLGKIK